MLLVSEISIFSSISLQKRENVCITSNRQFSPAIVSCSTIFFSLAYLFAGASLLSYPGNHYYLFIFIYLFFFSLFFYISQGSSIHRTPSMMPRLYRVHD